MANTYDALLSLWPENGWLARAAQEAERRLQEHPHGDLARWRDALQNLPPGLPHASLDRPTPVLGEPVADRKALRETLMRLHPWRKGPLCLGGITVDSEWRSDWKWQRIAPHVELAGQRILDVGCGNGYYGWRMLGAGAALVVGVDPTVLFVMQWLACRQFAGGSPNFVLPLRAEDLPPGPAGFDTVFSMGVLYHRRDPLEHLGQLKGLLRARGTLVLESLVLPADRKDGLLEPAGRYARMPNVWAVPGTERLQAWLRQCGFHEIRLVDVTPTTGAEQRSTPWMSFESLAEALDPDDATRTVEGYPAPVRAILLARTGAEQGGGRAVYPS